MWQWWQRWVDALGLGDARARELRREEARRAAVTPTSFEAYRGGWAVVTGASRGLGMGYATALAQRGLNLVLVARDEVALRALGEALSQAHGVQFRVIVADFKAPGVYERIAAQLKEVPGEIAVLINNVGGNPSFGEAMGWNAADFEAFLAFNVHPTLQMTFMVLEGMIARQQGYILNVSSINGMTAVKGMGMYCAPKAYLISFSACLRETLKSISSPVTVDVVCPGQVATDGILRRGHPSEDVPDPIVFANQSLDFAGTPFAVIPWLKHWELRHEYGQVGHFNL